MSVIADSSAKKSSSSSSKKKVVVEEVIEDVSIEEAYQTKTHLQHIMDLPDTYIGSIHKEKLSKC
jgi:hypothetical protein